MPSSQFLHSHNRLQVLRVLLAKAASASLQGWRDKPCDCISPYHYRAVCGSGWGVASTQTHCEHRGNCLLSRMPGPAQEM